MNKRKRARIRESVSMLEAAANIISTVKDDEQDCLDNYPENMQGGEKFEMMENAVEELEEAVDSIEEVVKNIINL